MTFVIYKARCTQIGYKTATGKPGKSRTRDQWIAKGSDGSEKCFDTRREAKAYVAERCPRA